jgi:hypothetical protein
MKHPREMAMGPPKLSETGIQVSRQLQSRLRRCLFSQLLVVHFPDDFEVDQILNLLPTEKSSGIRKGGGCRRHEIRFTPESG